jgi:hypothetical protein
LPEGSSIKNRSSVSKDPDGFDAKIGQTYEVWFIRDHFLYEITTYKELEPWLKEILSTWRFI